ncbi:glycosyltransferase family 4 protein [Hymenobacter sp. HDW8]|uniref:glycosyltransferase family 4 protein n=1 Tax=Hymenobacter sp. HDW8 TaxID=2714932 RepID=UPI00140C286F|nr:glycosyltransferase family 4 protein [Hymenobacter sp. HDW8]QIL77239.1 glycosyltransferase family 4 protein [Hymenobacter sp. HDW8]
MRILFFTPFAGRNGAEMMLWYIIKHINKDEFSCALFSGHRGPLIDELPESVPFFLPYVPLKQTLRQRIIAKAKNKIFKQDKIDDLYKKSVVDAHNKFKPDIWYINTVLCPEAVSLALELGVPYVVHFHDMLFIYQHITYNNLKNAVEGAQLLVGCSNVVCDKLKIMGGTDIALHYECIDTNNIIVDKKNTEKLRKKLNINNSFVWIMSGSVEYRKGTDLIPLIARSLDKSVTILWIGPGSSGYSYYIEKELKYYGIENVIMLGAKSDDYYDYLSLGDGLVLTSREDPFPLVMIEAAAMGLPIVSFNSGGVKEFVKDGMGIVIDSFDTLDLINAMQKVSNNEINLNKDISIARANEFDAKIQAQYWQDMMLSKNFV